MSVVVTGAGIVCPIGNSSDVVKKALFEGKNGIDAISGVDCSDFPVQFAGEVKDFNFLDYYDNPKEARRLARYIQLGFAAAKQAIEQAGIKDVPSHRVGVIVGSGIGGVDAFQENVQKYTKMGPRRISPFFIPMSITNLQSGFIAMEYGFEGPNFSISTACATGNHCIIEAAHMIERGEVDVVVAGGSEAAINASGVCGFAAQKALSTREDFKTASRPFDVDRDGFVIGEGAGVLVLESEAHARARNAVILARYNGGGMSCDAHHITAPHPEGRGAARAMTSAMNHAKLNPEQISYINGHATSTPLGDIAEVKAIKNAFGDHAEQIRVNATKSMIGHCLGAAAAIEAVAVIFCLQEQMLHPTINLFNQDPECTLNIVGEQPMEMGLEYGMSNSFGFGGQNSSVIFSRFKD
jgi:3-oxoacyl-[acyl-carrier-protein] synthase II